VLQLLQSLVAAHVAALLALFHAHARRQHLVDDAPRQRLQLVLVVQQAPRLEQ
jgi:hypothetical protein